MKASEIKVGQSYRYTGMCSGYRGSIDRVISIEGVAVCGEETHGADGTEHATPRPNGSAWGAGTFAGCHEPIAAPAPVASQHPADLKPRGVKAPMYLIPWAAVPFSCVPQALADVAERLRVWPDGDAFRAVKPGADWPRSIVSELIEVHGFSLEDAARAFEHGAKKYARDNWRTFAWDAAAKDEYFGAICRHLLAGVDEIDPDSGLTHGSHVLAGALIWAWHEGRS